MRRWLEVQVTADMPPPVFRSEQAVATAGEVASTVAHNLSEAPQTDIAHYRILLSANATDRWTLAEMHAGWAQLCWLIGAVLAVGLTVLSYKAALHQTHVDQQLTDRWDYLILRAKQRMLQGRDCARAPVNLRDVTEAFNASCATPRIMIMAARDNGRWNESIASSWRDFEYTVLNTTQLSLRHSHSSPCLRVTWPSRLFEIYKSVFRDTLAAHDDAGFVYVEVCAAISLALLRCCAALR